MTAPTELWGPLGSARPDWDFGRSSRWAHGQTLSRTLHFHHPKKKHRSKFLNQSRVVDGRLCADLGLNI